MKNAKLSPRNRNLLIAAAAGLAMIALFYLLAWHGIGIPCLFHEITGLQCPGCGNSRAALALLRLDFRAVLEYNLLFPLEIFYLGWVLFHCCKAYLKGGRFSYQPPKLWVDITILIAVLLWWILRNVI